MRLCTWNTSWPNLSDPPWRQNRPGTRRNAERGGNGDQFRDQRFIYWSRKKVPGQDCSKVCIESGHANIDLWIHMIILGHFVCRSV